MRLEKFSAARLGELVNKKKISPVESIKYFIDRIEKRNPSINAFTYTKFDEALEVAKKQEDLIMRGRPVGPFAGVPMALKDFLPSKKGWTHSHGGVECLVRTDEYSSEFCKAAEDLGAIAIGKTNAPAFGFSGACQNVMYGATGNPFDITRTSGGSSGGSAAAVADGLIGLAEGGDAGGSIRIPAGWCNLFGFKPSKGTVPSVCRPDGWAATHPFCFNGALTRTVEDSAIMLAHMAKYDPRDPYSLPINPTTDFVSWYYECAHEILEYSCLKIGFTLDFDLYPAIDPEVSEVVTEAALMLSSLGATVEEVHFNWKHSLEQILKCWSWAISVDTALDLEQWKLEGIDILKDHRKEVPEEWIYYNQVAARADIHYMSHFNRIRTDILDNFEDVFENYDFIISPTTICKPMPLADGGRCIEVNGVKMDPETNFISFGETPLVNFVGYPAASIPAGLTEDGLPVGMQIIGKMFKDGQIISLSSELEHINPWSYSKAYRRM